MYSYILTKDAEEDLDRIHEYGVHRFGMLQADNYYEMFFECFDKIASNPFMFPTSPHLNDRYRYCTCGFYTIYFKIVGDDCIEIITKIGRQDF